MPGVREVRTAWLSSSASPEHQSCKGLLGLDSETAGAERRRRCNQPAVLGPTRVARRWNGGGPSRVRPVLGDGVRSASSEAEGAGDRLDQFGRLLQHPRELGGKGLPLQLPWARQGRLFARQRRLHEATLQASGLCGRACSMVAIRKPAHAPAALAPCSYGLRLHLSGEVVWAKKNAMPEGRCRRPHRKHESIHLLARSERHSFRRSPPVSSVWTFANESIAGLQHRSRFPAELPRRCIDAYGRRGADVVVVDPFAGSGTTGLMALDFGCTFVGFEIDPKQVEAANQRLYQARRQRGLTLSSEDDGRRSETAQTGRLAI